MKKVKTALERELKAYPGQGMNFMPKKSVQFPLEFLDDC